MRPLAASTTIGIDCQWLAGGAGDRGRSVFGIENGAMAGADERGVGGAPFDGAARVRTDGVERGIGPVLEPDDDRRVPAGSGAGAVNGTVNATEPRVSTSDVLATSIPDGALATPDGVGPLGMAAGGPAEGTAAGFRCSSPRIRIGSASDDTATAAMARRPVWRSRRRSGDSACLGAAQPGGVAPPTRSRRRFPRPGSGQTNRRSRRWRGSTNRRRMAGPARGSTGCVPQETVRKKSSDSRAPPAAATLNASPVSAPIPTATSAIAMSRPIAPAAGCAERDETPRSAIHARRRASAPGSIPQLAGSKKPGSSSLSRPA